MSEEILGKSGENQTLEGGADPFGSRFRCPNCRGGGEKKLPIHCKVVAGEPVISCNNKECNCPCRTHYACKSCGHLHEYRTKCQVRDLVRSEPSKEMIKAIELVNAFAEEQREKVAKTIIKEET